MIKEEKRISPFVSQRFEQQRPLLSRQPRLVLSVFVRALPPLPCAQSLASSGRALASSSELGAASLASLASPSYVQGLPSPGKRRSIVSQSSDLT